MLLSLHPDYVMVHYLTAARGRSDRSRLRLALRPGDDRATGLRSERRRRFLGSHEPPRLARQRAHAARTALARVCARSVFERRRIAQRVRPPLPARHGSVGQRWQSLLAAELDVAVDAGLCRGATSVPRLPGGRTSGVAGTNADPNLYYFGGADGGVWKTTNGGLTWQNVWPHGAVGAIGAIAIDPRDRNTRLGRNRRAEPAQRYFVRRRCLGDARRRRPLAKRRLARRPGQLRRSSSIQSIHAACGSQRSAIHTATLRLAASIAPPTAAARGNARSILDRRAARRTSPSTPRDPNVVFAGIWQFRRMPWSFSSGGPFDGIFKSTDGGVKWKQLRGHGLPGGAMGRIGIGVASRPRLCADSVEGGRALALR